MGKFIGLVGALSTVGAVAYLMAPLPQSATSASGVVLPSTTAVVASKPSSAGEPAGRSTAVRRPSRGEPQVMLVQQIQTELHRLGCYGGAIDGQWNDATQRAMQVLGERVSVLRPVDTPDYIMLALARGQTGTLCASTQRSAVAPSRTRLTAIATPEIAGPGKGEMRPTSGAPRVAASEPDRPSAAVPPKVWRAVPDATPKRVTVRDTDPSAEAARLKSAREELSRIEMRKRAALAATTAAPPAPVATSADQPSQVPLETTRMALGVGPSDPLQAHIDPRNPNAPAILRAPPQPLPRFALQAGERPAIHGTAPPPARSAVPSPSPTVAPPPPRVTSKQTKRTWQRSVFTDMRFNGP